MSNGRDSVLAYLRRQGGELLSTDGRGITRRMAAALGYKLGSLGRVLADLEHDGMIEREIRGKRTYRIRLSESTETLTHSPAAAVVEALPTVRNNERPTPRLAPVAPTGAEDLLSLLIEIGVLERNFEDTVQHIERLRMDVEALMERCRNRMGQAGPVTIDLRKPAGAASNGNHRAASAAARRSSTTG